MRTFVNLVVLSMFVVGCNQVKPEKEEQLAPLATSKARAVEAHAHPIGHQVSSSLAEEEKGLVVAKVGERVITLGEIEKRLNEQPVYVRVRYNTLDKKKEFLDNLIRFELLAMEAREKGFDQDADVVFSMKQHMIKKLLEQDLEQMVSMSDVKDEDVASFYQDNLDQYVKPGATRVSQIVFDNKAKASQVLGELTQSFEAEPRKRRQLFTEAVLKHSVDGFSKAKKGDVGFFTKAGVDPDTDQPMTPALAESVRDAAFQLDKINGLSPVVEAEGTFAVLLLTNRRPEVSKSLEEVRRQIRNKLFREKKENARNGYVSDLRKAAKVEVNQEKLNLISDLKPEVKSPIPGGPEIERLRQDAEHRGIIPPKVKQGEQP